MTPRTIQLTEKERALFVQIGLDALALRDHIHAHQNGEFVAELMGMLIERKAIPEHRVRWFADADYNVGGRGTSRKERFERSGTRGPEIFRHPHFLEYLRYFIQGPDLPPAVLESFAEKIDECGQVTSSDIVPICKHARQLARSHLSNPRAAADEFFKLALEHGLGPGRATMVRKDVMTIR
jgi:hypothetical protein